MALDTVRIDYTNQLRTGASSISDGQNLQMRGTNESALLIQEHGGRMQEQTRRGNNFIYSSAAAIALLLPNTTFCGPTIWNYTGSNYICYITKLRLSFLSGTTVIGSVVLGWTANAGSGISATAPITAFTNVAPQPGLVGSSFVSHMHFAPAACAFVAAPVVVAATGINLGAAAPTAPGPYETDLDGGVAIYPGNALTINYSVTTSTALYWISIWGYEVGMVSGQ